MTGVNENKSKEVIPTPWKINMESKNHPIKSIEKEHHLPNHLHFSIPCYPPWN